MKEIQNRVTKLLNIKYPIIQGGMVWVSGWRLASAVSNCGGLGLIGSGSMTPELLKEHIKKCKVATKNSFGVNIPLLRPDVENLVKIVIEEGIEIVFTSAGNPAKYIELLKQNNLKVVHVVSNLKQAIKAQTVECDAVVGEGVEAGGHNGFDQLSMRDLVVQLVPNLKIPVIAAGGIVVKQDINNAFDLGAEGVQIGTLFASTTESSAHENYKNAIFSAENEGTRLIFKKIGLIRAIKNDFTELVHEREQKGATSLQLKELLGKGREKIGIFDGDLHNGLLEAGIGVSKIRKCTSVSEVFKNLLD